MGRSRSRSISRGRRRSRSYSRSRSFSPEGHRIHVADLGIDPSKREVEKAFNRFGPVIEIWVAKNPPCFAFIVYKYREDADKAISDMDGKTLCGSRVRVSYARPRTKGRRRRGFDPNLRCYQCGEKGHFSRDCAEIWRNRRHERSRSRSRRQSRRSRSYSRSRSKSHSRSRSRSRSHDRRNRRRDSRSRSGSRSQSRRKSEDVKKSRSRSKSRKEESRKDSERSKRSSSKSAKRDESKSKSNSPEPEKEPENGHRSPSRSPEVVRKSPVDEGTPDMQNDASSPRPGGKWEEDDSEIENQ